MSIVVEMRRKGGKVCERSYRNGNGCPLIVRPTSEDVLTGNVFGILRRLRPSLWLRPMLAQAYRTRRFTTCPMQRLDVSFWQPVAPPTVRAHIEGYSEVDVLVRFGSTMLFVENKYHAPLSTRTTHDASRDQLVRLIDVAWSEARSQQLVAGREPYVLVVGSAREEPPLVTRYRDAGNLRAALAHHRDAPDYDAMATVMSQRVGYLSWGEIARIVADAAKRATQAERPFLVDVAEYIDFKMRMMRAVEEQPRLALPIIEPVDASG